MTETLFIGGGGDDYAAAQNLLLKYANRHGLIAGATGTGKTVTLQIMAEGFSAAAERLSRLRSVIDRASSQRFSIP